MTPDAVARRWFKEVWNEGNESAIDRLMHPDAVAHGLAGEAIRGPEGFKGLFRTFRVPLATANRLADAGVPMRIELRGEPYRAG